jgi:hypothetical protein
MVVRRVVDPFTRSRAALTVRMIEHHGRPMLTNNSGAADAVTKNLRPAIRRVVKFLVLALLMSPTIVAAASTKALVLFVDVDVADVSGAGNVSFRKSVEDQASANVSEAIVRFAQAHARVEMVPSPPLTDAELTIVRRHAALAVRSAVSGLDLIDSDDKESARIKAVFPYSVGGGLRFIADRTGADAAFIVAGFQWRQTVGNAVFANVVTLASAAKGALVNVPVFDQTPGALMVLVNLRTGKLRWANRVAGSIADPSLASGADRLVGRLLERYPRSPVVDREWSE